MLRFGSLVVAGWLTIVLTRASLVAAVEVDVTNVAADAAVRFDVGRKDVVAVEWPAGNGSTAIARFRIDGDSPLVESLALRPTADAPPKTIARDLVLATAITVGTRNLDTPAGWTIFFDKVHERPYRRFAVNLRRDTVRATAGGLRGSLSIGPLSAGPFSGELVVSFFAGSPLLSVEAVVSTKEDRRAILYDAGLVAAPGAIHRFAWTDYDDTVRSQAAKGGKAAEPRGVNYRAVAVETSDGGAVVAFPPPHRFFYPLDFADNFGFNWLGRDYASMPPGDGFGVRQPPEGDRRFVPWINAPPGTRQRLGIFYLFSTDGAEAALQAVRRYTRSDRYERLPGRKSFTSHYHIEHTLELLKRQAASGTREIPPDLQTPDFVKAFRRAGVDVVHLAEFHNGRTPKLPTDERLRELRTLHDECRRLSDDRLLVLPGEEPNVHLGGHWISFFPRPVLWVLNRPDGVPFEQRTPTGETIYHVGSPSDVLTLMQRENGLMWTAHARIKSSVGFPDGYREAEFYKSPRFLGAAWKAMPADLSHDTLGRRVLDLLDDMNQWGQPKQALGEVDIFQLRPGYEFYGHANVNYVELDALPKYADGWAPLLAALREGRFFTTTGEILITDFAAEKSAGAAPAVRAKLRWTLPLAHAEVVGGDGRKIYRHRIDLSDTGEFGERELRVALPPEFAACRWLRLEVWDVAVDGAYTQPARFE